eukprot:642660-Amphidinium_carterae.1
MFEDVLRDCAIQDRLYPLHLPCGRNLKFGTKAGFVKSGFVAVPMWEHVSRTKRGHSQLLRGPLLQSFMTMVKQLQVFWKHGRVSVGRKLAVLSSSETFKALLQLGSFSGLPLKRD